MSVNEKEFRALVMEAVERMPEGIRSRIRNVAIVIENVPSPEQLEEFGVEGNNDTLLGFFAGLTRGEELTSSSFAPPIITLFRLPIMDCCKTRDDVEREIADTLWHEVAHYLGMDEDDVRHEEERSDARRIHEGR